MPANEMLKVIREKSEFNILNEDDFALVSVTAPRSDEELETTADEPAVAEDENAEQENTDEATETKE